MRARLFTSFFLIAFSLKSSAACYCSYSSLAHEFVFSDFIVSGRVIEIVDSSYCHYSDTLIEGSKVKVQVYKTYKGTNIPDTIIVDSGKDVLSICFTQGVEYLIFGSNKKGVYNTDMCTRTALVDGNKDVMDLKEYNTGTGKGKQTAAKLLP